MASINACHLDLLAVVAVAVLLCASTAAITSAQPTGNFNFPWMRTSYNHQVNIDRREGMQRIVAVAMAVYYSNQHIINGLPIISYVTAEAASLAVGTDAKKRIIYWYCAEVIVNRQIKLHGISTWHWNVLRIYYAMPGTILLPEFRNVILGTFYCIFGTVN
ncbi:hypothetical protein AXF42_Ash020942 [Apostasia shenzhenica]|uniref:Uncharacterized protein n=1 Tax=Apostasia shenzhenica TaxID=1088818 RepID=A0A2H9ZYR4_9ASPA|nr:hypothetical protein AXF42_Ash020942 [Apostasia shenzhenica]